MNLEWMSVISVWKKIFFQQKPTFSNANANLSSIYNDYYTNLLKNKVEKGPYNLSYSLDDIFQSEVPSKQSRKPIWPS